MVKEPDFHSSQNDVNFSRQRIKHENSRIFISICILLVHNKIHKTKKPNRNQTETKA